MSLEKNIVNSFNKFYTSVLILAGGIMYRHSTKQLLKRHPNKQVTNCDGFLKKWHPLKRNPDLNAFRLFSQYIGYNPNIAPEDITSGIIQPLLNPIEYRSYYSDKNMFDLILGQSVMPKTLFRFINGQYYDSEYNPLEISKKNLNALLADSKRIFIKPSVDTSSGKGICSFSLNQQGNFIDSEGCILGIDFFDNYKESNLNFIVQKGLTQSQFISQFNPTSINTIRIATYRSVIDNEVHICGIILRIGKMGAEVDNAHAGGMFIGVKMDGTLCKFACDQYGNTTKSFNGIDFHCSNFKIPNFDKILDFAKSIGKKIIHHRLIAMDICIEEDGTPKLVEFNIRGFSVWLFQFTVCPALGEYTDEIINYCKQHKKEVSKVHVEPF